MSENRPAGYPPAPVYQVVLVPVEQVTTDGCKPGMVKLTGTPGKGSWDEWGPYPAVGREQLAGLLAAAMMAGGWVTGPDQG